MTQELKLKLGGKTRKFTFGILFIGQVLKRLKVDYIEMFKVLSDDLVLHFPMLLFESLSNTYKSEEKYIDFTEKDVVKWLNKEPLNGIGLVSDFELAFMQSLNNEVPVENEVEEPKNVKKK